MLTSFDRRSFEVCFELDSRAANLSIWHRLGQNGLLPHQTPEGALSPG